MGQWVEFQVQGSARAPYTVAFIKNGDKLSAYCTCPDGRAGHYCKHRFAILSGVEHGIVSRNANDIAKVSAWFRGTPVEAALHEIHEAARAVEAASTRLSLAKKTLADAMRD